MPTTFTPTGVFLPWRMTNGGMSLVVDETPLSRASRPMRTNWWTALLPER
jgi:hypothetical protein